MAAPTLPPARPPDARAAAIAQAKREALLKIAGDPETEPATLDLVAREPAADDAVLQALARNPATSDGALVHIALVAGPSVLTGLLVQGARLRAHPPVAHAIIRNPKADAALRAAAHAVLAAPAPGPPPRTAGAPGTRAADLLAIALDPETEPATLDLVAREQGTDELILLALVRNPATPDEALAHIATAAPRAVLEELAAQRDRLRAHPAIAQGILKNRDADEAARAAARDVLLPEPAGASGAESRQDRLLRAALDPAADPEVRRLVIQQVAADEALLLALAGDPRAPDETLVEMAAVGPPAVLEAIAGQAGRIRAHPAIGRALLANAAAAESLRGRVAGLVGDGAPAPGGPAPVPFGREGLLAVARNPQADPEALNIVAREAGMDEAVLLALARNPATPEPTLVYVALVATPAILAALAGQAERLRAQPAVAQAMLENPDSDDALRAKVRAALEGAPPEAARKSVPIFQMIKGMSTGQRLALALKGNKEARMILIKDPNEMVALEVIYSPRITETEIVAIAQMRDVNENVLRAIAGMKLYRANKLVVWALLTNPKTPPGVAIGLGLANLSEKELEQLVKNRNISSALQRAARAALDKKRRRSGGGHGH